MTIKARLTPKAGETESRIDIDLSNAVQLISQVDDGFLLAHQEEAMQELNKLFTLFMAHRGSRKLLPKEQFQPPPRRDKSITPTVSAVLCNLDQQKENTHKSLLLSANSAVPASLEQESEKSLAPNIVLLNDALSSHNAIKKAIAHRRLGLAYENWELARFKTSRINDLVQDQDLTHQRRGHISEFVEHFDVRLSSRKDQDITKKGVQYAIKIIVLERLCQNEVVSAVVSFAFPKFRTLRFNELPPLKEQLQTRQWIADILIQKVEWYQQCQKYYDGKSTHSTYFSY